jgi:hypothetical protein
MNTYEEEKIRAMLKSYEETIDEVVKSHVVHPFPDVRPPRYSSYRARSKKTPLEPSTSITASLAEPLAEPLSHNRASLKKLLLGDYKQVTNTVSCSHEDSACTCLSAVRENTTIKDKYSRDYREIMFKKAQYHFTEFYNLFRYFDRQSKEEKKIYTSLKQERFNFLLLDPSDRSDVSRYHSLIVDIMEEMCNPCPVCLLSRFEKAFYATPVNFVNSDCGHTFCSPCFKNDKIVSITFLSIYYLSLFLKFYYF